MLSLFSLSAIAALTPVQGSTEKNNSVSDSQATPTLGAPAAPATRQTPIHTPQDDDSPLECIDISKRNHIRKNRRFDRKLFRQLKGKKIGEIDIVVDNIFDENNPAENRALYRAINKLQVNTRENVVRNQLLFDTGDAIKLSQLRESLRILFNREYLLDATLTATQMCGDRVNVRLWVRDAWVIDPRISLGREGGENTTGFGLRDGNFMGTGNEVAVVYENNADRSEVSYRFRSQDFLRRRLAVDLYHAELSDGNNSHLSLAKPFYSVRTRFAYGIETGQTVFRYKTRFADDIINEFKQTSNLDSVFAGLAVSRKKDRSYRLKVGYTNQQDRFSNVPNTLRLPPDDEQKYPWIEFERATNQFEQYTNLSYIARPEDIEIGANYRVRLGAGEDGEGNDIYRLIGNYSTVLSLSDNHLFRFKFHSNIINRREQDSFRDSIIGAQAIYSYFIGGKNSWYLKMNYDEGRNLSEYRQLTVGEVTGVRGYPLAYQRGEKRYVFNIERRFYSDLHILNLVRAGALVFADFGRAWGAEEFTNTKHLRSTGFGLRFHSSKTGNPAVVHLNIGVPLSDKQALNSYLFSVSVNTVF